MGRSFVALGMLWVAFVVLELVVWGASSVGSYEPVIAILMRLGLAAGAFATARAMRRGTLPVPPVVVGVAFVAAAIAITVLGIGLSVSPNSALGFMSFSGGSRAVNVFLPEVRQGMQGQMPIAQGAPLIGALVIIVTSVVASFSRARAQVGPGAPSA